MFACFLGRSRLFRHILQRSRDSDQSSYGMRGGQMEGRWGVGTWLGKSWRQDAHLVHYKGEIVESRAIRSLAEDESWSIDRFQEIKATPWNLNPDEGEEGEASVPEVIRVETTEQKEVYVAYASRCPT